MSAREIAFLVHGNEGYGVSRTVTGLVRQFRRWGHDVTLYSITPGSIVSAGEQEGARAIVLDELRARRSLPDWPLMRLADQMSGQVRLRRAAAALGRIEPRPELQGLIVRSGTLLRLAGVFATRQRVPCIWLMPNMVSQKYPFDINRRAYRAVIGRYGIQPVANSRYTAETLGFSPVPSLVSSLGVDPAQFAPERVSIDRGTLGIPADAPVAGIMARLVPEKGQLRILEAMIALGDRAENLHLLICGGPAEGDYAESIRSAARRAGCSDRLHLVDCVDDPAPYYLMCDFVINSRVTAEPFGLSVIEAMMLGRPVLAHACGGPADTVIDGVTGWHTHDASAQGFARALDRALSDRSRWPELGRRARQRALDHFTLDAVGERLLGIIRNREPCKDRSVLMAAQHAVTRRMRPGALKPESLPS